MLEGKPYTNDLLESWLDILTAARDKDNQQLERLKEQHARFFPEGDAAPERIDHILSVQSTRNSLTDSIARLEQRLFNRKPTLSKEAA